MPQIMEQPLARLRTAHQWEQRAANKARTKNPGIGGWSGLDFGTSPVDNW